MVAMRNGDVDPIGIQRARRRPIPQDSMVPEGFERLDNGMIVPQRPQPTELRNPFAPPSSPPPKYEGMDPEQWDRFKKLMKIGIFIVGGAGSILLLEYLFL